MRNSLHTQRDKVLFDYFKEELKELHQMAENQEINLYYLDETGVNLNPNVPYAWQPVGETTCLPAKRGGITILGLLSLENNHFEGTRFQGAATAEWVIKALDDFVKCIKRPTIVVLDNATIHTANKVKERRKEWKEMGLELQFIPAYSPELNLIEILWKQLKHFWFNIDDYSSLDTLENAIDRILGSYGKDYQISFA